MYTVIHAHTHTPLFRYTVANNMNKNSIYMNEIRRSLYCWLTTHVWIFNQWTIYILL